MRHAFASIENMGQHMIAAHSELKPETIVNRVNFTSFLLNVKPEIVCKGKDTLEIETFIREGIYIKNEKPVLNNVNNLIITVSSLYNFHFTTLPKALVGLTVLGLRL